VVAEFDLKVRGKVEYEDKYSSSIAAPVPTLPGFERMSWTDYTSKCRFASNASSSVEATIFVRSMRLRFRHTTISSGPPLVPCKERPFVCFLRLQCSNIRLPRSGLNLKVLSRSRSFQSVFFIVIEFYVGMPND
jgi:hypothetical protein